jgi:SAM-dependent methyltransferase
MTWYQTWFADSWYMELYAHRDAMEAREAIDVFTRLTGVKSTDGVILDLACGTGRHAFQLAQRGFTVVAADLSPTLLNVARRKNASHATHLRIVRADMRLLPFAMSFAAVVQLFTSFGYFPDDESNSRVISNVAAVLLRGGWYMLDFLNPAYVRRNLVPTSMQMIDGIEVVQHRSITGDRVEKRIEVLLPDAPRIYLESVQLYTPTQIFSMMEDAGLHIEHHAGDYDGSDWNNNAPRSIVFARKRP